MIPLKKKLTAQGITLEQFAFQFVVVVLGVYLAILFESKAEDRSREAEARTMLENVLAEIKLDEADILEAILIHEEQERAGVALMNLLATASSGEEPAIDSLMVGPLRSNVTVFPRRSAYSTLVAGGNIGHIRDSDLTLQLADLYEHHFRRLITNGDWVDKVTLETFFPNLHLKFWDKAQGRLFERGVEANRGFWNLADSQRLLHGNYVIRMNTVLAEIRAVEGSLETYLSQ